MGDINIRILGWQGGHITITGDERILIKALNGKFRNIRPVGKTKNKIGGRSPVGHITDPRNTWIEKTSRRRRRRESCSEGGHGPKGAVVPWNGMGRENIT